MWNYCASFFIATGKENQNPIVQIKNLIASILIYCCADDQWFTQHILQVFSWWTIIWYLKRNGTTVNKLALLSEFRK